MSVHAEAVVGSRREPFSEVFRDHRRPVVRLASLLCGDPDVAEDAAADAFARVYPKYLRGGIDDIGAYLRRATVNAVRSRQRRLPLVRRERDRRAGDHRGQLDAAQLVADRDQARQLLQQLSPRQRTAITLRFWADLPDAESAAAMGCPVVTYRSLISRGLARLRVAPAVDEEVHR